MMKQLPDDSVDAVITDPPYGVDIATWDNRVPHELLEDFLRLARQTVVWFGSAPNAFDDIKAFSVEPDRMMIWAPKFTLSKIAKDGFAYRFHPLYWWRLRKQKAVPWDLFNDATECGNWWMHKCTKPLALMEKIALAATARDETVLDPFMGSGTTGVACMNLGRKFIGIEIDPTYFEIACKRIEAAQQQSSFLFPQ